MQLEHFHGIANDMNAEIEKQLVTESIERRNDFKNLTQAQANHQREIKLRVDDNKEIIKN